MISSLLSRELDNINILWIPSDNRYYEKFMSSLGLNLFSVNDIYFGQFIPDLIISNNKMNHLETVVSLCHYHHCNLILVDHEPKSDMIDITKLKSKLEALPNVYQIAVSENIKRSWPDIHNQVIGFDSDNDRTSWLDIIHTIRNKKFIYEQNSSI